MEACARALALAILAATLALAGASAAEPQQPSPIPKFDVASIMPCHPGESASGRSGKNGGGGGSDPNIPEGVGGYFRVSPGRLDITCGSILTMIYVAYIAHGAPLLNMPSMIMGETEAIQGLPKWALSPRYTIHAESENGATKGPTQPGSSPSAQLLYRMLQTLLEDRFQLKIHRQTGEAPMYALTVAKSGLKLKPMKEGDCTTLERGQGMKRLGPDDKPYCRWTGWDVRGPNRVFMAGDITLARLASDLGEVVLDRNVLDRTGIPGSFVIRLEYAPDEHTRCFGRTEDCAVDATSDLPPGPSIFGALEQQLGLKLEPVKGPQEHLAIDHVDPPSEN